MFPQWWSDLHDSFITDNIFPDKKVPLNFGSHADFRSESFLDRMRLGRGLRQTEVWRWSVLCVSTILIFSGGAAPGQMTFWKIHRPGSVLLSPAYCVASVIVWTENKNVTIDRFIYFIWTRPLKRKGASGWPGWRIFRPGSFWHWRRHCLSCLCTLWGRKVASPQENFLQYFYSQWTYINENYLGYCSATFLRLYQLLSINLNICMNCVILTSKTTQILTNQFSSLRNSRISPKTSYINTSLLNIKINPPKLANTCRYKLSTNWQNFTVIYSAWVKVLQKVIGKGATLLTHTVGDAMCCLK